MGKIKKCLSFSPSGFICYLQAAHSVENVCGITLTALVTSQINDHLFAESTAPENINFGVGNKCTDLLSIGIMDELDWRSFSAFIINADVVRCRFQAVIFSKGHSSSRGQFHKTVFFIQNPIAVN